MSLTSILKDSENQELRDKFKNEFIRPEFKLKTEIKAEALTNNWGIVGTAFDYLTRFYLEHLNKNLIDGETKWVADYSYQKLINKYSKFNQLEIRIGSFDEKVINDTKQRQARRDNTCPVAAHKCLCKITNCGDQWASSRNKGHDNGT
jgi:hypothetical protein